MGYEALNVCASGTAVVHAGTGGSTNASTMGEGHVVRFISGAAAFVCMETEYDWITNWSSLPKAVRPVIEETVACRAANHIIKYDMITNYNSTREAENLININWDVYRENIRKIKDYKLKRFTQNG